jgi:hypothetical protein
VLEPTANLPREPSSPGSVTPVAAAPRSRRRWPWALAVVLLLAATAAAVGVAYEQRQVAATWRDRAIAVEAQRDEAIETAGDQQRRLEEQLATLGDAVATSEADVADLEERLRELADEKAQAEDAVVTGEVEREALREVSARVGGAVEALDACVTQLFDLQAASVEAFNRAAAGETVDVEPLNTQATRTTDFCNDARAAAANAGAAADQLLGP